MRFDFGRWREFAVLGAQLCKGKDNGAAVYDQLAQLLRECAERERRLFTDLRAAV